MTGSEAPRMQLNGGGLLLQATRILALGLLFAAVITVLLFYFVFVRASEEELDRRGRTLVTNLEQHAGLRLGVSTRDRENTQKVLLTALQGDSDLDHLIALDADGHEIAFVPELTPKQLKAAVQAHLDGEDSLEGQLFKVRLFHKELVPSNNLAALPGEDAPAPKKLGQLLVGLSPTRVVRGVLLQTLFTLLIVGATLLASFALFFRQVRSRISRLVTFAEHVKSGDLTRALPRDRGDEIGNLTEVFNGLNDAVREMVVRLQGTAGNLTRVCGELLESTAQQSASATQQNAAVHETGATVTELRQAFDQAEEKARSVIDMAQRSEEFSAAGEHAVSESVSGMGKVREQVGTIATTIVDLSGRMEQIGEIIATVNDISERSNLLALNAAIEAARAAEHGRGFSVVATEMRTLAERSKQATDQVRLILADIQKAVATVVGVTQEGNRRSEDGMKLVQSAGESIRKLAQAIIDSSQAAKQIAASTKQQSAGVEQISQAIQDISGAAVLAVSGTKGLEKGAQSLKQSADEMFTLVSRYRTGQESTAA